MPINGTGHPLFAFLQQHHQHTMHPKTTRSASLKKSRNSNASERHLTSTCANNASSAENDSLLPASHPSRPLSSDIQPNRLHQHPFPVHGTADTLQVLKQVSQFRLRNALGAMKSPVCHTFLFILVALTLCSVPTITLRGGWMLEIMNASTNKAEWCYRVCQGL